MSRGEGPRILRASESALLLEYSDLERVLEHEIALRAAEIPGVVELVPAARTILVRFNPQEVSAKALASEIRHIAPFSAGGGPSRTAEIGVVYGGDDLQAVADLLGMSAESLIRRHTSATWQVAFVGFAPGFAYCVGDDRAFEVPRRTTPRTRIPAGSVALAANFSAIYPSESPGGWQLIGRTAETMWDLDREHPALLEPGDTVRYCPVRDSTMLFDSAPASSTAPVKKAPQSRPSDAYLEVLQSGAQALLQDLGRPGHLHIGVPESGAVDRASLRAANRILGNDVGAPCLELVGGGAQVSVHAAGVVAVTGAVAEHCIRVETENEQHLELPLERGIPTAVEPGDVLCFGAPSRGLRTYLAVRGGFVADAVLGSVATDTLSGIGREPLRTSDRLLVESRQPSVSVLIDGSAGRGTELQEGTVELRIALGPRADWLSTDAIARLCAQPWVVSTHSNRVGIRLVGDEPLEWSRAEELASEGAVTGAIQVPPDGQPVVFLADHPVTGGYPIAGTVIERDLDLLGQLSPGDQIRFVLDSHVTDEPHPGEARG